MIADATTLFRAFFQICLLRFSPGQLPRSYELLTVSLIAYTLVNFLLALFTAPLFDAVLASLLESALVALITVGILSLNRHYGRWVETLMALAGTGFILGMFALPLIYGGTMLQDNGLLQAFMLLVYIFLVVWNILIMAHILRHAIDTTFGFGIVFALAYIFITSAVIVFLLPDLKI
jgi:drug/metabolite transporter (DMT)-like permease